jgi:hypothetical protein
MPKLPVTCREGISPAEGTAPAAKTPRLFYQLY